MLRIVITVLVLVALQPVLGYGDDSKPRYVSEQGEDVGDCSLPVRPCRTIGYAQRMVRKGEQIRVASGTYELDDTEEIFNLTSGVIDIRGGYNRFDHFLQQAPQANKSALVGVPSQYRDALRDRGFHVISDIKSLDIDRRRELARFHETFQATQQSSGRTDCSQNRAGTYFCDKIDLLSHMAFRDFSLRPHTGADIWGFVDLNTEREYALFGFYNGTSVVDVTDPESPFEVGSLRGIGTMWRDLKVVQTYDAEQARWNAYAYVSGESPAYLQVIDLTDLPNRISLGHRLLENSIHNVYISNVDYASGVPMEGMSPLLQVLGASRSGGKFRAFDLVDPLHPVLKSESTSGYSHDASSLPVIDSRTTSCASSEEACEVLIDFNEDTFDLWDFSDQSTPRLLSSTTYSGASYVHSGWWSEDGRYVFVHDELDENYYGLNSTLRIFDITDLANPSLAATWSGPTRAIDHNGYVRGNRYYMSNYTRGVTVLDITDPASPRELGYFDTYPVSDATTFSGAWGVFPFLPSGTLLVSDYDTGLYILEEHTRESESGELSFTSSTYGGVEGQTLAVSVQRTEGSTGPISVDYSVYAGSADSGDITVSNGTFSWTGGDSTARSISVPLLGDSVTEPIERAFVRLNNPTGGAVLADTNIASIFVADPGMSAKLEFAENHLLVEEDSGRVIITVKRTGTPVGEVSASIQVYSGTALAGSDYVAPVETGLTWSDGDGTARTVIIDLIDDDLVEEAETFGVRLVSVTGAIYSGGDAEIEIGTDSGFAVTGIMLYDNVIAQDTRTMFDGIKLSDDSVSAARLNFRVEVQDDDEIGSLNFDLTGPVPIQRTISGSMASGLPGGRLLLLDGADQGNTTLTEGHYEISATPYADADLGGAMGRSVSLTFVVGSPAAQASSEAQLSTLGLSGIDFTFSQGTYSYDLSVANDVAVTTLSATASHGSASLDISPADSNSSQDGHQVALAVGTTEITIRVTAEDGVTTQSYSLSVERAAAATQASTDATLSSLTLSGVSFAFDSQTETYNLVYDGWLPMVTVSATATDDGANLVISPEDAMSAFDGHQVRLASGMNTITVTVTAEDGSTTKTYTLNVERVSVFSVF